jgi:hypothetical protein
MKINDALFKIAKSAEEINLRVIEVLYAGNCQIRMLTRCFQRSPNVTTWEKVKFLVLIIGNSFRDKK